MDVREILRQYDEMMGRNSVKDLQDFLTGHLQEALSTGDKSAQISLYNELVGITRRSGDIKTAVDACGNVIRLMGELGQDKTGEFAIALINIATTYRAYGIFDEAKKCYDRASSLMDELGIDDPMMMSLYNNNVALLYIDRRDYNQAKEYLERALILVENEPTLVREKETTLANLEFVDRQLNMSHMERCREFYEHFGAPMIEAKFPDYKDRIAAGLVGEGSECFGFDDEISKDHDFSLGFCMWLRDGDYDEIGEELRKEYDALIERLEGPGSVSPNVRRRHGVFKIREFYSGILHIPVELVNQFMGNRRDDGLTVPQWMAMGEMHLAAAVNGEVFTDPEGQFTRIRNKIGEYYPEEVWKMRLADKLHEFSQSGQYNYPRMMARGDYVTAKVCLGKAMDSGMELLYLLNRAYAPYYKWRRKGLEVFTNTAAGREILDRIALLPPQIDAWKSGYNPNEVNLKDSAAAAVEELAGEILGIMKEQKIVDGEDRFLDIYVREVLGTDYE